jgi:hypothetical protein
MIGDALYCSLTVTDFLRVAGLDSANGAVRRYGEGESQEARSSLWRSLCRSSDGWPGHAIKRSEMPLAYSVVVCLIRLFRI